MIPDYLRIRDVKDWYIDFIAESLKDEENNHEELTSPPLVIASVSKSEFKDKNISKYTYKVCLKISIHACTLGPTLMYSTASIFLPIYLICTLCPNCTSMTCMWLGIVLITLFAVV